MSPVHTAPSGPTDSVPELAVSSPLPVASSEIPVESVPTLIPRYGVCPVLVRVAVYRTIPPGVVVAVLAVKSIASWETVTVAVHRRPGAGGRAVTARPTGS